MAYGQWIEVELVPADYTVLIKNAGTSWGKFYQRGDKDKELSSSEIDSITLQIGSTQPVYICSCGREDAASGTEGSFEIWDGETRVGVFQWNNPWGAESNSFSFQPDAAGYLTTITGGNDGSTGPIGAVTLTTQAVPVIVLLYYQSGVITMNWTMSGLTTATPFQVTIKNGKTGATADFPATGFSASIQRQLDPDVPYEAVVTRVGAATSAAVPIITASTQLTLVQNALQTINVTWKAATGYAYAVTLTADPVRPITTTEPAASFNVAAPLSGTSNTVSVRLQLTVNGAISLGPPTQYTIITDAPTLSLVDYANNTDLTLTWAALSGCDTFVAYLQPPTGDATSNVVTGLTTVFPGKLGSGTYNTCVCACSSDGVSVGPPSKVYSPITLAPTMTQVINTGSGLQLAWDALPSYTMYRATMQAGGSSSNVPVAATSYTFPGPLPGNGTTCSVSAMSDDQVAIGPPSTIYTAITDQPKWNMISYDAGQLTLTWVVVADPSVKGYLVYASGLDASGYAVGNVDTTTVAAKLTPLKAYPATVCATNGIVRGPPSAVLVPLTAPPTSPSLGFNGTKLQLSWVASGETDVTGYAANLFANGSSSQQVSPATSPQVFDSGLDAGAVFTSQVRAVGAKTQGPWSAVAAGPYRAQLTYGFDSQGRLHTIRRTGGAVEIYGFDDAGNLLSTALALPQFSGGGAPASRRGDEALAVQPPVSESSV